MHRLLIAVASLVAEYGLQGTQALVVPAHGLSSFGSPAAEHRVSCCIAWVCHSEVCGILPDQVSNLCLLFWQVDSLPLSHQGSPKKCMFSSCEVCDCQKAACRHPRWQLSPWTLVNLIRLLPDSAVLGVCTAHGAAVRPVCVLVV